MARLNRFRRAFDPKGRYIVRRPFPISGAVIHAGDIVENHLLPVQLLRQLFEQRFIAFEDEDAWDRTRPPNPANSGIAQKAMVNEVERTPPPDPLYGDNGVYIPPDWRHGGWQQMLSLASKFAKSPITSKMEAFACIELEELRRQDQLAKWKAA